MHRRLLLLLLVLAGAGCGWFAKKPEKVEPSSGPKLVGRVASISAGGKFVLIESYGKWSVPNGAVLVTLGQEKSGANLYVTGERLGAYAAADLRSGEVHVGDLVYSRGNLSLDGGGESVKEVKEGEGETPEKKEGGEGGAGEAPAGGVSGVRLQKFQSQVVEFMKFQKTSMDLG